MQAEAKPAAAQFDAPTAARQYLSFRLGAEEYAVDILRVREVRRDLAPTRVPHAPQFVRGVVNLHGHVIPLVDLRARIGLARSLDGSQAADIVLDVGPRICAVTVDAVCDVHTLQDDQLLAAPELGSAIDARFIEGLFPDGERLLILLDIAGWLASPAMQLSDQSP